MRLTFYGRRLQAPADALHVSVRFLYLADGLSAPQLHQLPQLHHGHPEVPVMVALCDRIPRRVVRRVVGHVGPLHGGVLAAVCQVLISPQWSLSI